MITVREYARLGTRPIRAVSLDFAVITQSAFDWLLQESERFKGLRFFREQGDLLIRVNQYVGLIETPCGTRIEILPKIADEFSSVPQLRALMLEMIAHSGEIPYREIGPADLQTLNQPVHEWVMGRFLKTLDLLLKKGLRFDYQRIEEENRYVRGQLDMVKQLRQLPGKQHFFHIRPDIFSPNRAENRLLRAALDKLYKQTKDSANWRLANELLGYFMPIPASQNHSKDFRAWRQDRLMAHYKSLKPLCELILYDLNPLTQLGAWQGISWLFSMDVLFEKYVAHCLKRQLPEGHRLHTQSRGQYLCRHQEQNWFQLKPDLILEGPNGKIVLDTKWKRLDARLNSSKDKYGLSQSDFYQLFTYGQYYLGGQGDVVLIYPANSNFQESLPLFEFMPGLRLWVLPFDLQTKSLVLPHQEASVIVPGSNNY